MTEKKPEPAGPAERMPKPEEERPIERGGRRYWSPPEVEDLPPLEELELDP